LSECRDRSRAFTFSGFSSISEKGRFELRFAPLPYFFIFVSAKFWKINNLDCKNSRKNRSDIKTTVLARFIFFFIFHGVTFQQNFSFTSQKYPEKFILKQYNQISLSKIY